MAHATASTRTARGVAPRALAAALALALCVPALGLARRAFAAPRGRRDTPRGASAGRRRLLAVGALPDGAPDVPPPPAELFGVALPPLPQLPFEAPSLLPTISQAVWDDAIRMLLTTSISWGVPALLLGLALGQAASNAGAAMAKSAAREKRLRRAKVSATGAAGGPGGLMGLLGGGAADGDEDVGAPAEFLKVERLNDKLDSFVFSLQKATESPATALAAARKRDLRRRFGEEIGILNDTQMGVLIEAEDTYKKEAKEAAQAVEDAAREVRLLALEAGADQALAASSGAPPRAAPEKGGKKEGESGGEAEEGKKMPMMRIFEAMEMEKKLESAIKRSIAADSAYLRKASAALGAPKATEERKGLYRLVNDRPFNWDPSVAPLELPHRVGAGASVDVEHGHAAMQQEPPVWYVLEFFGDIQASQVEQLRQEVTAIVGSAKPSRGDGVVLVLNSGGGTVTGYGLAAAQLMRIKSAGLKLTICVEQVAASGGYMMACVADRLVAAPFAVLGSIGVITDIPNVYDRLKNEGIEFQTITAGKFKRTLTPTKKVTEEDVAKTKEDIEAIFKLFRGFVGEHRPQLDLESVATGETWFGQDALARKLVDELKSSDDVLLDLRKEGADVYSVKFQPKAKSALGQLLSAQGFDASQAQPAQGGGGALAWWAERLFEFATGRPAGSLGSLGPVQDLSARPDQVYRAQDTSPQKFW